MAESLEIKLVEAEPAFDPAGPDPARLAEAQQEAAEAWAQTLLLQKKATTSAQTGATPAFSPTGPSTGNAPPGLAGPLSEEPKERSEQLFELLRRQPGPQPKQAAPEPPGPTDLQRDYAEAARKAVEQAERGAAYAKAQVTKGPETVPEGLEEEDAPEVQRVDPGAEARELLRRREQQRRQEQMQREHQEEVRKQMRSLSPDFRREDDQRQQQGQAEKKDSIQRIVGYGAAGAQAGAAASEDSDSRDMKRIGQGIGAAGNIAMGVASKDPMKIAEGATQLMQLQEQMRKDREEDRRQRVEWIGRQATRAAALDPGQAGDLAQQGLSKIKEWGPALAEAVKQTREFSTAISGTVRRLSPYSGALAQAQATNEIRDILRDMRRAQRLDVLAPISDAVNRMENAIKDIQSRFLAAGAKIANKTGLFDQFAKWLESIDKKVGEILGDKDRDAAEEFMKELLEAPDAFFPGRPRSWKAEHIPAGGGR